MDDSEYAEIIVMIADRQHRRKGLAREAVSLAVRCSYVSKMTRAHTLFNIRYDSVSTYSR